jgi:hypothetical protein
VSQPSDVIHEMTAAARTVVSAFSAEQREAALYPFISAARTQWTYLPGPRPGVTLLGMSEPARKATHRLLAAALSRRAFAQAVTIMALEEVLDLDERGRLGRYSDDYRVALFGVPGDEVWAWRFEGHHLSVSATVGAGRVVVAPLFLGANPARIEYQDRLVVGALSIEEDLARTLLAEMGPALREQAIVDDSAPYDIRTGAAVRVNGDLGPSGVPGARLGHDARDLLGRLVDLYVARLTPALAEDELRRIDVASASFAWEGGTRIGEGHYYRIQAADLLIEYDNTQRQANHVHTVLRRPGADFGSALLPEHLAAEAGHDIAG